jgi:hypothetical protein
VQSPFLQHSSKPQTSLRCSARLLHCPQHMTRYTTHGTEKCCIRVHAWNKQWSLQFTERLEVGVICSSVHTLFRSHYILYKRHIKMPTTYVAHTMVSQYHRNLNDGSNHSVQKLVDAIRTSQYTAHAMVSSLSSI